MSAVSFLASTVDPKVAAAAGGLKPWMTIPEIKTENQKPHNNRSEEEEEEMYSLSHKVIRTKLIKYSQQVSQYEVLEKKVEEEKETLEKMKRQMEQERSSLKRKLTRIQIEMAKRNRPTAVVSNNITPAQLQQQMNIGNINMFMNQPSVPPQQLLQQQQQYQLQMQMQMQLQMQQQQLHLQQQHQQRHRGRPAGQGMNMSL
ncbi:hypothetical protein G6F68_014856 [Rhizopus microsporus]|nr:hypothetical protein G6F68_014856 [Rhizopus microsporus]